MCTEKSNYLREKILIIPSLSNSGPRVKVQYFKFLKHFKAKLFYSHILLEIIMNLTPQRTCWPLAITFPSFFPSEMEYLK